MFKFNMMCLHVQTEVGTKSTGWFKSPAEKASRFPLELSAPKETRVYKELKAAVYPHGVGDPRKVITK